MSTLKGCGNWNKRLRFKERAFRLLVKTSASSSRLQLPASEGSGCESVVMDQAAEVLDAPGRPALPSRLLAEAQPILPMQAFRSELAANILFRNKLNLLKSL